MRTYMPKAEGVERKWYLIDASNMVLGRLATQVAVILRGKNKPTFTPNVDTGDFVIVINTNKIVLTGNKLDDKMHRHHSGYIGNLKEETYRDFMKNDSDKALFKAVKGMMPKNNLGRDMIKKLKVYKDANHGHEAQKPEVLVLKEGVR